MTTALRGGPGTGRQYRPPWPRTQGPCSRTRIYGAPGRSAALAGTPDLLFMNIAQFRRDQRTRPTGEPGRRRTIQNRQDALTRLDAILRRGSTMRPVGQARQALPRIAATPQAHRPRHRVHHFGDRSRRAPLAANRTIRARNTSRCCDVGARTRISSTDRSSGVNRTSAGLGIIQVLIHVSEAKKKWVLVFMPYLRV
jgi:hypothetical protein